MLTAITASADGSAWALDDEHGLLRLDDPQPVPNPPDLRVTAIAATSATHLWALMTDGNTLIWDGESWREGCKPGDAFRLSAGSDGTLWSTTEFGAVSQCIMEMWSSVPTDTQIDRLAVASADAIWALGTPWGTEDVVLLRWADAWEQVDPTRMVALSAGADGLVCGVDLDGRLSVFLGGQVGWAPTHFMNLTLVAAGAIDCVWAVGESGQALHLTAEGPLIAPPFG